VIYWFSYTILLLCLELEMEKKIDKTKVFSEIIKKKRKSEKSIFRF